MNDDPTRTQITLEVSRADVPLLLAQLGAFATEHNIFVDYHATPPHDPALATLVPSEDGSYEVPIVTGIQLESFMSDHGRAGVAERLMRGLSLHAHHNDHVRNMLWYSGPEHKALLADGIQVKHMLTLHRQLMQGTVKVYKVGQRSVHALGEYCDELFPSNTNGTSV